MRFSYQNKNDGREYVDAEAETDVDGTESQAPVFIVFFLRKICFVTLLQNNQIMRIWNGKINNMFKARVGRLVEP